MKTDNSHFEEKVRLRLQSLPEKNKITVLDCYAGKGLIWKEVEKRAKKEIQVLSIEVVPNKNKSALLGNNLKYLKSLDLFQFDIIDLDAYGIPFEQLKIIFESKYKGILHVTAIQSMAGQLPYGLLLSLGYTVPMIKKIKSIFNTDGFGKLKKYLYLNGVQYVTCCTFGKKNYFYFTL